MKVTSHTKLPPGPKSLVPFANVFGFRKNSLKFLKDISTEYGDIAQFKMGPLRVVLLNHPDYIKEVLSNQHQNFIKGRPLEMAKEVLGEGILTSAGDLHKEHSRIIQPAFHIRMMELYVPAMTNYSQLTMDKWQDGQVIDMLQCMIGMSTEIAAKTMFNVDINNEVPEINNALEDIMSLFGRITMPFAEILLKLPIPSTKKFFKARAKLDDTIYKIIENRKKNPLQNGDLLSLLLNTQEDTIGISLTDKQIRDEALTLLLTAFDTTSLALTWTWYLLSLHPEIESKMHQELDSVLNGGTPTLEDYPKLKYTKMVFEEAMRMYPPIYVIAREALQDVIIADYKIPKKSIVLLSPYLIHHDARFHHNPEKFDPEALAKRLGRNHNKYEFFPFSVGPRSCIGQHYAMLEGVMVLASMGSHWCMETVPNQKVEMEQLLNLRPKNGIKMRLVKRPISK
ncbi:cytochrome P450 [Aegicerativicinus sediminis]|uniref:cytochrome P450 n=1 Tax=Aegicerativicinus sediminis TaxID=2893202 RepID=UPI001E3A2B35|nr:cytochrome P450 [Aegicerativicinus sediminis]